LKLLTLEIGNLVQTALIALKASGVFPEFEPPSIEIRAPKKADQGDYACAVAMQVAAQAGLKAAKVNPFDISLQIVERLPQADFLAAAEAVRPGFINFRLNESWLKTQVESIILEGDNLFSLSIGSGKRAQVEFVSANPTGPLHVGRSRGAMVGDTMARLLEAAGYTVEREYYFNNAGVQMMNLGNSLRIRYLEALGDAVEVPSADDKFFYQGTYLRDFAQDLVAEHGDSLRSADWKPFKEYAEAQMLQVIKDTLARVNIHHDVFFNENSLYDTEAVWETLKRLEAKGHVYRAAQPEHAGDAKADTTTEDDTKGVATWFRSAPLGDKQDRVLVKSDGNPTYTLPDIAYHANKIERGFDLLINVLGADHGSQYKVVGYGINALGLDASKIHVILIQLVSMIRDGKEVKISTRAGNSETLDDLINLTSPDVVRYLLLARNANSHLDFDLDLAVKQSNENPVYYIQNAHVRCAGIFREAEVRGITDEGADLGLLGETELRFIRKVQELGEVIALAAQDYEPHRIAFYAHELASVFHPIYDEVRALSSDIPAPLQKARLRFYRAAQISFKRVLTLMGMTAPERM
jgi:arginyl-tRNA synthetase